MIDYAKTKIDHGMPVPPPRSSPFRIALKRMADGDSMRVEHKDVPKFYSVAQVLGCTIITRAEPKPKNGPRMARIWKVAK